MKATLMSLNEWRLLLKVLALLDGDITERDATMCFAWSRMCVVDETTRQGRMKENHLPFEGFLEAIVRLAGQKALPTDDEIEEAECTHAAEYFAKLRLEDESSYTTMVMERGVLWGEEPSQPIWRCVAHTLAIIIAKVEHDCGGSGNSLKLQVSESQCNTWAKSRFSMKTG